VEQPPLLSRLRLSASVARRIHGALPRENHFAAGKMRRWRCAHFTILVKRLTVLVKQTVSNELVIRCIGDAIVRGEVE